MSATKSMMFGAIITAICAASMSTAGSAASNSAAPEDQCGGEKCIAVVRGLVGFLDRRLHGLAGNGRSCADCHMPTDNFQLSPADAETRFQLLQARRVRNRHADDPLFRPVDADDFRLNGINASDFSNLRENGLIRVTIPLPANMRLIDPATSAPSGEIEADVWRMVPTVNNVRLTGADGLNPWTRGPNVSGGYQLDGRFGSLQEQARGALTAHAQVGFAPPQRLLDDLSAFQNVLFSSPRVRVLSDAIRNGATVLPDADPPLNALEQQGKVVFIRACAHCHGGPGQSTPQVPVIRYHSIASTCPRPVDTVAPARFTFRPCPERLARNARTYEITLPTGELIRRTTSDPGRALLTGFVAPAIVPTDDWNKFDMPGLLGIRHTAPYFHNNSADTLEDVVDHYIEFFKRGLAIAPPGVAPPFLSTDGVKLDRALVVEERAALLAYLRKL